MWPGPLSQYHQRGNSQVLFLDTKIVRDDLYEVNVHKSVEFGGIHHKVLVELVDVMA